MLRFSSLFFFGLLAAVTACSSADDGGRHEPPGALDPNPPRSIEVDNRTGAAVDLGISHVPALRVARGLLEGAFALPIPDATMRPESRHSLAATDAPLSLRDLVEIVDGDVDRPAAGVVLRIGDGPRFLAIGDGTLSIRRSEAGTPFFEVDDPRALFLLPVDRPVTECAPGTFDEPFDAGALSRTGSQRTADEIVRVKSVSRDTNGCRWLVLGDTGPTPIATMRACVPDELYPFADSDPDVRASVRNEDFTSSVSFQSDDSPTVTFTYVPFGSRTAKGGGLDLEFEEDVTCAHVDSCGSVHTPIRLTARTSDGVGHRVAYGAPIADPTRDRTFYVLAASGAPVASMSCAAARASAWIVTVDRTLR